MVRHLITGVTLAELKIIKGDKGDILRMLRPDPATLKPLGEAYFSTVNQDAFKGWKQHTKMQLNIAVPVGRIKFFLLNTSSPKAETACVELSVENYHLLTVEPGVWMGFKGVGTDLNMLLNIASIPHDPAEAINEPEDTFMHFFV